MSNSLRLSRRDWLRLSALGVGVHSFSGWFRALADEAAPALTRKRSCILLWMPGGPTQTDTFDMKPEHRNGGEFKPIETSVPGLSICEHLPQLAKQMQHVALVRSMQTKEGDHLRAAYHLRTGYRPQVPVRYPTLGSLISHELAPVDLDLPGYVSIMPQRFFNAAVGPGFLGPKQAPLFVGQNGPPPNQNGGQDFGPPLTVEDITLPGGVDIAQADARLDLLGSLETEFGESHPGLASNSHQAARQQAVRMMRSSAAEAFKLEREPDALRERYGRNRFGQACLLARRLVEQGVPFIEITLSGLEGQQFLGWDTHQNNFSTVSALCNVLDPGWATLIDDLQQRGLLDTTLIMWMGEFGRTPNINGGGGRDHFPNAWSTVLCGGGIRGGTAYGATSKDGNQIADKPVSVAELLATVCKSLGIDHTRQNMSNVGRPIRVVEPGATPIAELLA